MTSPTNELQKAAVAALVADEAYTALVAASDVGPAVFATGQAVDDVWPRTTLGPPQRLQGAPKGSAELVLTLHHWARGPDATLVAGEIADASVVVLDDLVGLDGWRISSRSFVSSVPVGDPNPDVEHVVTTYRFTVHRNG